MASTFPKKKEGLISGPSIVTGLATMEGTKAPVGGWALQRKPMVSQIIITKFNFR